MISFAKLIVMQICHLIAMQKQEDLSYESSIQVGGNRKFCPLGDLLPTGTYFDLGVLGHFALWGIFGHESICTFCAEK